MKTLLDQKVKCKKCGHEGARIEFKKDRDVCLGCQRKYENEYNKKNRDKVNARNRRYRENRLPDKIKDQREKHKTYMRETYRERSMLINAKKSAKKRGLDFNIDVSDVSIPDLCPLLGIKIVSGGAMNNRDTSPSLDRKIPGKGYIKGNVGVISYRANRIKNDATKEEIKKIAENIDGYVSS